MIRRRHILRVGLLLAFLAFALVGTIYTLSRHGKRYACGLVREGGKVLVVTAGLGTSGLPLRLGAVPDLWLLDLGPE